MNLVERRAFTSDSVSEIIKFSQEYGLPPYHGSSLIKRFLTRFISSNDLVLDLFQNEKRVAAAVLLDQLQNSANSVNLEIIGINKSNNTEEIMKSVLKWAKEILPHHRFAVDVSFHLSYPFNESIYCDLGFRKNYSVYEMRTRNPLLKDILCIELISNDYYISELSELDFNNYYFVVKKSFEKNEDTNIPLQDEFKKNIFNSDILPIVIKCKNTIIGFCSFHLDKSCLNQTGTTPMIIGEINSLGVLPDYRHQGFGKILLDQAILRLKNHGAEEFRLSVSVLNERALGLYLRTGFLTAEHFTIYRYIPCIFCILFLALFKNMDCSNII